MSINLDVSFSHPAAIATAIQYARIDNLAPGQQPTFISVPNINAASGTFVIATNIPDGQYVVSATPIYADGRACTPSLYYTAACPGLTSFSATIQGGVIIINYLAPSGVTNILVTINYPNGGSYQNMYVNNGNPISIGLPAGVYGTFSAYGQSVCDPISGFYSAPSSTVSLPYSQAVSGSYYLGNSVAAVCANNSPTTLYSAGAPIPGSTLYQDSGLTTKITGYSYVSYQGVIYNLDPVQGVLGADTGQNCNVQITGNNGLSTSVPSGNGLITSTPGRVVNVFISAGGPSGGTYTLNFNIASLGVSQSVTNGNNTFTFTMPASGSVAWTATYTGSNSDGGGGITVS